MTKSTVYNMTTMLAFAGALAMAAPARADEMQVSGTSYLNQSLALNASGTGVGWPGKVCFRQVVETELDEQTHVDPDHPHAA